MKQLTRLVRFAGWYSVIGGLPLALPFLHPTTNARLRALTDGAAASSLGGPALDATHLLLANTAGLLMMFMGFLLLYAARGLAHRAGIVALVATARLLFSALVLYYLARTDLAAFWAIDAAIDTVCSLALLALLQRQGLLGWRDPVPLPAPS